jgi:hypothetical protein
MKNIILSITFVILSVFANAQNNITWYRITRDTNALNYNPFATNNVVKTGYININPKTGVQMRYISGTTWTPDTLIKIASSNNQIYSSTENSPEAYGAVGANLTFAQKGINQDTINAKYPGIGATSSDNIDWAAWQMAVKNAGINGGSVRAKGGTYYIGTKSITLEKYSKNLVIEGNYSKIVSSGATPIFYREVPTSNSDANIMVELKTTFRNLTLKGTASQIGIDIGPSYGAFYQNIIGETLGECVHLRFALRTTVENCFATNCNIGWVADRGNWTGSSNSNSQSNHTTFRSCRWFGSGDCAFNIQASSGCVVEDCIIEGTAVRAGIDFNGQGSTVVKDFTVRNTHFECANGASEACIKIRMHSGIATIEKVYGQYASILVDAGATTGYLTVKVSQVSYWVMKLGKAFNNAGNCSWILEHNDNPLMSSTPSTTIPAWFSGTAVSLCSGSGCGSNRFFYNPLPR